MENINQPKILIVDDVPSNITVLTEILMNLYSIVCATNGEDALKLADTSQPDLILLDIMMPGINGYEVCSRLKADETTRSIPVIFLSAKTEEKDMVEGLELGAVDYISKPFSPVILKHKIKIHIDLKRHRENLEDIIKERTIEITKSHDKLNQQMAERIRIQKQLIEQRAYFMHLFENSPQAIMIIESDGKVLNVNKGFEKIFGYNINEVKGKYDKNLIVSEEMADENETLLKNILSGKVINTETFRVHKSGRQIPVAFLGYPAVVKGEIKGLFVLYKDISERKKYEEKMFHQAFHDSLTDIPNRALLIERISQALERVRRRKDYRFAVLMIDLDNFKSINDSMGHQAGDQFLIQLSRKLKTSIRKTDTLARMGGDEFAVLLEAYKDEDEVINIAQRISQIAKTSFFNKGNEIKISASIGIVLDTRKYSCTEKILRDADIAMYRVKETGKANFTIFKKKMHRMTLDSLKRQNDLRYAIFNDELRLFFQPIVSLPRQDLLGFEALVRWQKPVNGLIFPDQFIPLAESTGLIIPLGQFVIKEACRQLKKWQETIIGGEHLTMNVNVSIKQFMDENLADFIFTTLDDIGLDPKYLNLEITENLLLERTDFIVSSLGRFRKKGINVVLDDFGTGYSSLSYIQDFTIDSIKIDRSFIEGIEADSGSAEIVKTIVTLCNNLNLGVVAEGVESLRQLEILNQIGCKKVQGYYFSRPLEKSKTARLIEDWSPQFMPQMNGSADALFQTDTY